MFPTISNGASEFGGASSVERLIVSKKVDGVIFPISIVTDELLSRVEDLNLPCVILGHLDGIGAEINWIDINNVQAGRRAVKMLLQKGYKKIAFISDGDKDIFNQDRIIGYRRELAANGISFSDRYIIHGIPTVESGMESVLSLVNGENPPDAVICSDDRLALGALRAAQKIGLSVPDVFGIFSFDNTPLTEFAETSITSTDVDTYELGIQAAEILMNQIENPQASLRQVLLSTKIIERESTARK
ncbi:MAG: LacI family DNA-binding transcriptional regulator [Eubacterium ramulus]|uniref:LacI family DNA-binding transcriptional regulator n=1 Tax=Eubacterium ramulus TaxID=39490 RepID=UPI0039A0C369